MNTLFPFVRNHSRRRGIKGITKTSICTEFWSECTSASVATKQVNLPKVLFRSLKTVASATVFFCASSNILSVAVGLRVNVADLVAL
jgi:hypothetical protein